MYAYVRSARLDYKSSLGDIGITEPLRKISAQERLSIANQVKSTAAESENGRHDANIWRKGK